MSSDRTAHPAEEARFPPEEARFRMVFLIDISKLPTPNMPEWHEYLRNGIILEGKALDISPKDPANR